MHPIENVLGETTQFLNKILTVLEKDGIDISKYELDHICYRVETEKKYEELKQELSKYGSLLAESQIGGRPISNFKLNVPIIFKDRKIWCIELPSPKKEKFYPQGYEHAEFVIDVDFKKFQQSHPKVNFDTKSISKPINPDLRIKYDGFSVKFHHNTLEYVIKYLD